VQPTEHLVPTRAVLVPQTATLYTPQADLAWFVERTLDSGSHGESGAALKPESVDRLAVLADDGGERAPAATYEAQCSLLISSADYGLLSCDVECDVTRSRDARLS
jgi:hypothetical protein